MAHKEGWVMLTADVLAADCEKVWLHAGWEDTMLKWSDERRVEEDGRIASAK